MAQFQFILWLLEWYQETSFFLFQWDEGNEQKSLQKHNISVDEIESVFLLRKTVLLGIQMEPVVSELRFGILGQSKRGRILSIVFTLRDEKVRPISGRLASRKERVLYEKVYQALEDV